MIVHLLFFHRLLMRLVAADVFVYVADLAPSVTAAAAGTEAGSALLTATTGVAVNATTVLGTASGDLDLSALVGKSFTIGTQTINFTNATSSSTTGSTTVIGLGTGTDSTSTVQDILNAFSSNSSPS